MVSPAVASLTSSHLETLWASESSIRGRCAFFLQQLLGSQQEAHGLNRGAGRYAWVQGQLARGWRLA